MIRILMSLAVSLCTLALFGQDRIMITTDGSGVAMGDTVTTTQLRTGCVDGATASSFYWIDPDTIATVLNSGSSVSIQAADIFQADNTGKIGAGVPLVLTSSVSLLMVAEDSLVISDVIDNDAQDHENNRLSVSLVAGNLLFLDGGGSTAADIKVNGEISLLSGDSIVMMAGSNGVELNADTVSTIDIKAIGDIIITAGLASVDIIKADSVIIETLDTSSSIALGTSCLPELTIGIDDLDCPDAGDIIMTSALGSVNIGKTGGDEIFGPVLISSDDSIFFDNAGLGSVTIRTMDELDRYQCKVIPENDGVFMDDGDVTIHAEVRVDYTAAGVDADFIIADTMATISIVAQIGDVWVQGAGVGGAFIKMADQVNITAVGSLPADVVGGCHITNGECGTVVGKAGGDVALQGAGVHALNIGGTGGDAIFGPIIINAQDSLFIGQGFKMFTTDDVERGQGINVAPTSDIGAREDGTKMDTIINDGDVRLHGGNHVVLSGPGSPPANGIDADTLATVSITSTNGDVIIHQFGATFIDKADSVIIRALGTNTCNSDDICDDGADVFVLGGTGPDLPNNILNIFGPVIMDARDTLNIGGGTAPNGVSSYSMPGIPVIAPLSGSGKVEITTFDDIVRGRLQEAADPDFNDSETTINEYNRNCGTDLTGAHVDLTTTYDITSDVDRGGNTGHTLGSDDLVANSGDVILHSHNTIIWVGSTSSPGGIVADTLSTISVTTEHGDIEITTVAGNLVEKADQVIIDAKGVVNSTSNAMCMFNDPCRDGADVHFTAGTLGNDIVMIYGPISVKARDSVYFEGGGVYMMADDDVQLMCDVSGNEIFEDVTSDPCSGINKADILIEAGNHFEWPGSGTVNDGILADTLGSITIRTLTGDVLISNLDEDFERADFVSISAGETTNAGFHCGGKVDIKSGADGFDIGGKGAGTYGRAANEGSIYGPITITAADTVLISGATGVILAVQEDIFGANTIAKDAEETKDYDNLSDDGGITDITISADSLVSFTGVGGGIIGDTLTDVIITSVAGTQSTDAVGYSSSAQSGNGDIIFSPDNGIVDAEDVTFTASNKIVITGLGSIGVNEQREGSDNGIKMDLFGNVSISAADSTLVTNMGGIDTYNGVDDVVSGMNSNNTGADSLDHDGNITVQGGTYVIIGGSTKLNAGYNDTDAEPGDRTKGSVVTINNNGNSIGDTIIIAGEVNNAVYVDVDGGGIHISGAISDNIAGEINVEAVSSITVPGELNTSLDKYGGNGGTGNVGVDLVGPILLTLNSGGGLQTLDIAGKVHTSCSPITIAAPGGTVKVDNAASIDDNSGDPTADFGTEANTGTASTETVPELPIVNMAVAGKISITGATVSPLGSSSVRSHCKLVIQETIPTVGEWGLINLALLMAIVGLVALFGFSRKESFGTLIK